LLQPLLESKKIFFLLSFADRQKQKEKKKKKASAEKKRKRQECVRTEIESKCCKKKNMH
jgi:hypothetical protein